MKIYLKQRIHESGFTLKEVAKKLNIQYATLSNWARGVHEPDYKALYDISKILNIPMDYFFVPAIESKNLLISDEDKEALAFHQKAINKIYKKYGLLDSKGEHDEK